MRNSFIFYSSYYEAISKMPDNEQGATYKAIIDYAMTQKTPKLTGTSEIVFMLVKPVLDASIKQYENGIKGGRPPKPNNNPNKTQQQPKQNPTTTQTKPNNNPNDNLFIQEQEQELEQELELEQEQEQENNFNVSKKVRINNSASAHTGAQARELTSIEKFILSGKTVKKTQSYDEVMDDLEVEQCMRPMVFEFIKHCQANGKLVINSKLVSILIELDFAYGNDTQKKIQSLKTAIQKGYFDIAETNRN